MLKGVKVGENVEVDYTEAAALKVEKGPAPPVPPAAPAAPAKK